MDLEGFKPSSPNRLIINIFTCIALQYIFCYFLKRNIERTGTIWLQIEHHQLVRPMYLTTLRKEAMFLLTFYRGLTIFTTFLFRCKLLTQWTYATAAYTAGRPKRMFFTLPSIVVSIRTPPCMIYYLTYPDQMSNRPIFF